MPHSYNYNYILLFLDCKISEDCSNNDTCFDGVCRRKIYFHLQDNVLLKFLNTFIYLDMIFLLGSIYVVIEKNRLCGDEGYKEIDSENDCKMEAEKRYAN